MCVTILVRTCLGMNRTHRKQKSRDRERQISAYSEHFAPTMLQAGLALEFLSVTGNVFLVFEFYLCHFLLQTKLINTLPLLPSW